MLTSFLSSLWNFNGSADGNDTDQNSVDAPIPAAQEGIMLASQVTDAFRSMETGLKNWYDDEMEYSFRQFCSNTLVDPYSGNPRSSKVRDSVVVLEYVAPTQFRILSTPFQSYVNYMQVNRRIRLESVTFDVFADISSAIYDTLTGITLVDFTGATGSIDSSLSKLSLGQSSASSPTPPPTPPSYITTGLNAYWDAGNLASFNGVGPTWANLVAVPADGSAQADYDMTVDSFATFYGIAGNESINEFFEASSGILAAMTANTTFMNSMHKNSAAFTIEAWIRTPSTIDDGGIGGTGGSLNLGQGIFLTINSTRQVILQVSNATGGSTYSLVKVSDGSLAPSTIYQVSVSIDESGALGFFAINGVQYPVSSSPTFNATYTAPSSGAAAQPFSFNTFRITGRLYQCRVYQTALTIADIMQNFNFDRLKYGI